MKKVGIFVGPAFAVCLVAFGPGAASYLSPQPAARAIEISVDGKKEARVGELVKLVASGQADRFVWVTEATCEVEGNKLFFSAEKPGVYVFFLIGISPTEESTVKHTVVVGKPVPRPDDPPKPDDPIPDPPKPPVVKTLADKVAELVAEVKSPLVKGEAAKLAILYRTLPQAMDGQLLVDSLRTSTDKILGPSAPFWLDFREKLRVEVNTMKLKSFGEVCGQIADGLERGAK